MITGCSIKMAVKWSITKIKRERYLEGMSEICQLLAQPRMAFAVF